jgi:hypothetical protein
MSGSIDVNLGNFSDTLNAGSAFGNYFVAGFATQGNTMGTAAGIAVAVGFLITALLAVLSIVMVILKWADDLKGKVSGGA